MQERLIRRWREVHAEDAAAAAKPGRSSAARASGPSGKRFHVGATNAPALADDVGGVFVSAEQRELFNVCRSYKDVVFPCRPYPTRCFSRCCTAVIGRYLVTWSP